jgi:two-component system response regulator RegX3
VATMAVPISVPAVTYSPEPQGGPRELRVGDVVVDPAACLMWVRGRRQPLVGKELALLTLLLANAGRVVTTEEIEREVWNASPAPAKTIAAHILRLRRRVEVDPHRPTCIRTVRGVGYIFDLADGYRAFTR